MAIVVDTADGKYLISDIIEKSINQSLTEPAFYGPWYRILSGGAAGTIAIGGADFTGNLATSPDSRLKNPADPADLTTDAQRTALQKRVLDTLKAKDFRYDSEMIANGMMYYIGYNENFANYTAGTASYVHTPTTQRLRIGLAHPSERTMTSGATWNSMPTSFASPTRMATCLLYTSPSPRDS